MAWVPRSSWELSTKGTKVRKHEKSADGVELLCMASYRGLRDLICQKQYVCFSSFESLRVFVLSCFS